MLSMEDCIAFSGLTRDQIDAIACFKHIPPIIAAEWAELTLESEEEGLVQVETILTLEVAQACAGQKDCAVKALSEFHRAHPDLM